MNLDEGDERLPKADQPLAIEVDAIGKTNFASAQNDIAIVRRLQLRNDRPQAFESLNVRLSVIPPIIREKIWKIDRLNPGATVQLRDLALSFDVERLASLDEAERGELRLDVTAGDAIIAQRHQPLIMLARDEWGGVGDMAQLLAAYVSPNDPAVAGLLKEASRVLERAGHDGSMEGYQSDDPQRVWLLVGALWSAATALGLTYAEPPASFELEGQKVRGPSRIRSEGLATCLDSTLLLAAAFEATGLNPVVLFTKGHAFVGVWLVKRDFGAVTEPDVVAVRKAIQSREFLAIETTLLTKRPTIGLKQAVDEGRRRLSEEREDEFVMAVDIARSRAAKIYPLASHVRAADGTNEHEGTVAAPLPPLLDFDALPSEVAEEAPTTATGRIERWQRKLLDLSLRNRLLNFVANAQTVPLLCPDISKLEDMLADGKRFQAFALREDDPVGARILSPADRERIEESAAEDAFAKGQVAIPLTAKDADNRLLALYRRARSDMQEGGTNTLFLAAGFLRWKKKDGDTRTYRAPLLLLPVKLERRSAQSKFTLAHHEDEVRFNSTLIEMLKRDFDLKIPEFEGDLPRDESGVDVPRILNIMRQKVRDVAGFEVVEDLALATFSFAKYLMWKDLVDRSDQLCQNALVRHLVENPTEAFAADAPAAVAPRDLDTSVDPVALLTPLPADSSQLAAVVAAGEGRDFVLIGPPGTGKSQTIANIICQCLASGKSVLFVAEKAAALDVVNRRLTRYGLADAILELHSNKTDRKAVLDQLGRNWDRASGTSGAAWIEVTDELRLTRDQLNAYVAALHEKGSQGFSVFDAISWLATEAPGPKLAFASKDAHDTDRFRELSRLAGDLARTHAVVREGPAFETIQTMDWSHAWEARFFEAVERVVRSLVALKERCAALEDLFGLSRDGNVSSERRAILGRIGNLTDGNPLDLSEVPDLDERRLIAASTSYQADHAGLVASHAQTSVRYQATSIRRLPIEEIDTAWRTAQAKMWPFSIFARGKVRRLLATYCDGGRPDPGRDIAPLFELKTRLQSLDENPLAPLARERDDPQKVVHLAQAAARLKAVALLATGDADEPARCAAAFEELASGRDDNARRAAIAYSKAEADFAEAARLFNEAGGSLPEPVTLGELSALMAELIGNRSRIADWIRWLEAKGAAEMAGLGPVVEAVERGTVGNDIALAFRRAYARWWLPLALDARDELRRFAHWEHNDRIKAFRAIDDRAAELAPAEIMRRIAHQLPAKDGVPRKSELGTLRHQLGLKRPSLSVRALLSEMPDTLPKLAPCVLMSPLSIAQYLPAGAQAFDVVIFDEASQITTWDAVGAIARGRQAIIVGDPKQLPPTNFFGRSDEGSETDEPAIEKDMPSILDEVASAGIPTRRLDWHYRSRDEALIAFSNHFYYGGGLVTFPAPATGSDAIRLHKTGGVYARGKGRINEKEAKAAAAYIRGRLQAWLEWPEDKRPTLGVITFNTQQQGLIMDLLDEVCRQDPRLEWFFSDDREEPLIVKNLENIQGDERDVMLFSTTFGPDLAGKLTMNFGALNSDGGERRLNVAVTRARQELHVFASITADQIDLGKTRATGVRDFKAFLDYAERGPVALPAREEGSLGPAESPFEEAVAEALRAKGWDVRTQVGVSGFRIDLGVVNPDHAGAYLAGVECDGAQYHSSATARDRDKIRQAVLEGLGWRILRIWSTDWFRNWKDVLARIDGQLLELLQADRAARAEADEAERAGRTAAWEWVDDTGSSEQQHAPVIALPAPSIAPEIAALPPGAERIEVERIAFQEMRALGAPARVVEEEHAVVASDTEDLARADAADPAGDRAITDLPITDLPIDGILDAERFFDPEYAPVLQSLIVDIVTEEGPMPVTSLARAVAVRHGWQRTGGRIFAQVQNSLGGVLVEEEFGTAFVWAPANRAERVPFRGLGNRTLRDVSRSEIAWVIDQTAADLAAAEDPTLELARRLGINRLSKDARSYLDMCRQWQAGAS